MSVIAEPQRISILTANSRTASPAEETSLFEKLMGKIANSLYPAWAHQMAEELREKYAEK